MKTYNLSLFIFRQDLRIEDNTALFHAIENSHEILPIFILDDHAKNDFGHDDIRFGFIREAIEKINNTLKGIPGRVNIYEWNPENIVEKIYKNFHFDAIFVNRSYSPRGKIRDENIANFCRKNNIDFLSFRDFLLVEGNEIPVRKVFTPFSKLWKDKIFTESERLKILNIDPTQTKWKIIPHTEIEKYIQIPKHPLWTMDFGLERLSKYYGKYSENRNIPSIDGTTRLSPYIRFGVFSIRMLYQIFENNPKILSELIWREFWYHIAFHFPKIYNEEFQENKKYIQWKTNTETQEWKDFINAKTGYPLVDAAIRQLYETNWMHNRLRMVVASFLTKNLGYDWRLGEKWFKQYLIDYDEAVNIGNWQWSASVGADPKPIRVFNPILQAEKFDSEAKFIKKYISELRDIPEKNIIKNTLDGIYIKPIIEQKQSARDAKERYQIAKEIFEEKHKNPEK